MLSILASPSNYLPQLTLTLCRKKHITCSSGRNSTCRWSNLSKPSVVSASAVSVGPIDRRQKRGQDPSGTLRTRYKLRKLESSIDRLLLRLMHPDLYSESDDEPVISQAQTSTSYRNQQTSRLQLYSTPPSPDTLVDLVRQLQAKRKRLQELDEESPRAVAAWLLSLSGRLSLSPAQLLPAVRRCPLLMGRRPERLAAALTALTDIIAGCMAGSTVAVVKTASGGTTMGTTDVRSEAAAAARAMVCSNPELLLLAPERLRQSALELRAVCKARGIQAFRLLSGRPDLLTQSAARLAAKMDALPQVMGLPPRSVRALLEAAPELLRRSPTQLSKRFNTLQLLFGVPPAFLSELLLQEPRVMSISAAALKAKFEGLVGRYGRFQDDVVDMILVDPEILLKAPPAAAGGAAANTAQQRGSAAAAVVNSVSKAQPSSSTVDGTDGTEENGIPANADRWTVLQMVLDKLQAFAAAVHMPVDVVLDLVVQNERVVGLSSGEVADRLEAIRTALGLAGAGASSGAPGGAGGLGEAIGGPRGMVRVEKDRDVPGGGGVQGEAAGASGEAGVRVLGTVLAAHPGLLLVSAEEVAERAGGLAALLGGGAAVAGGSAASMAAGGGGGVAAAAIRRHPELLLQDPEELRTRMAQLADLLVPPPLQRTPRPPPATSSTSSSPPATSTPPSPSPPARLLALVASLPGLLAAPPSEVADRLAVLGSLFEIPGQLVLELVWREPALLSVPTATLERKFRSLAASFGAFSADAIDAVMADPDLILTAGEEGPVEGSGSGRRVGGGEGEWAEGTVKRGQGGGQLGGGKVSGSGGGGLGGNGGMEAMRGGARRQQWGEGSGGGEQGQEVRSEEFAEGGQLGGGRRGGRGDREQQPGGRKGAAEGTEGGVGGAGRGAGGASQKRQQQRGGSGGAGSGGSSSGGGSGDLGALGAMSAADFDRLGQEGLPPAPPPSVRRRRRQQQ